MLIALTFALATQTAIQGLSQEYVEAVFRASPTAATFLGYHLHDVDRRLDDVGEKAHAERVRWLRDFSKRLEAAAPADLEDEADRAIMRDQIAVELLVLEQAHDYTRRCDQSLDSLGAIFFTMVTRDYAPLEKRASDVTRSATVPLMRRFKQCAAIPSAGSSQLARAVQDDDRHCARS